MGNLGIRGYDRRGAKKMTLVALSVSLDGPRRQQTPQEQKETSDAHQSTPRRA
jgi:hypothetical protein